MSGGLSSNQHSGPTENILDFLSEHKSALQAYMRVIGCSYKSKEYKPIKVLSAASSILSWPPTEEESKVKARVQVSRIGCDDREFQTVLIAGATHQWVMYRERFESVSLFSDEQKEPVETMQRLEDDYPYELYIVYDEIEYFELLSQEEWDQEAKQMFAEHGQYNPQRPCCENCAQPENQRMSTYCGKCHGDGYFMFKPKGGG